MTPSPIEIKRMLLRRLIDDHGLEAALLEIAGEMVALEERLDASDNLHRMTVRYLDAE